MVNITIDGRDVIAKKGASLLHVCLDNGAPVPYFCDHRKLDPIGACRMCVVQIEGQPKLATTCTITTSDGMKVLTESPDVIKAFGQDRSVFRANMPWMRAPEARAAFGIYLERLDEMLGNQAFFLGTQPTIADFSVYHCLWFVFRGGSMAQIFEPFRQIAA